MDTNKIFRFIFVTTIVVLLISCDNKSKLDMVKIPGMNIEMLRTEVTQDLYLSVIGDNPSSFNGGNLPVEYVSWYDAWEFCNALSKKYGYTPAYSINGLTLTQDTSANGFRLPTTTEWEYAAKGGANYTYAGSNNIDEVAWHPSNSRGKTHPVAQKKANGYGLYDMSGNVWEWCWDDGLNGRAIRGGSWKDLAYSRNCEVSGGGNCPADRRYNYIGFRIVRTIK